MSRKELNRDVYVTIGKSMAFLRRRRRRIYTFSQPTRLYRCARVVSDLVKNSSTRCLSCLNSVKDKTGSAASYFVFSELAVTVTCHEPCLQQHIRQQASS